MSESVISDDNEEFVPSRIRAIKDEFVQRLAMYFESDEVTTRMEAFFTTHCTEFHGSDAEQTLENTKCYEEFLGLVNTSLDGFSASEGMSTDEAFVMIKAAQEDNAVAKRFVDMVLATTEYPQFATLMTEWAAEMA